jgi:catechol 2,3-dioxygenase-like lactoylglutathione lyase family enzyme
MKVMRIVPNIATPNTAKAKEFYADVLGLDLVMDLGWIATYASNERMAPQISIASEGGSGTNVPEISIEVDDLEETLRRVKAKGAHDRIWPSQRRMGP